MHYNIETNSSWGVIESQIIFTFIIMILCFFNLYILNMYSFCTRRARARYIWREKMQSLSSNNGNVLTHEKTRRRGKKRVPREGKSVWSRTGFTAKDLCQKHGQAVSSPNRGVVRGRSRVMRAFDWFTVQWHQVTWVESWTGMARAALDGDWGLRASKGFSP